MTSGKQEHEDVFVDGEETELSRRLKVQINEKDLVSVWLGMLAFIASNVPLISCSMVSAQALSSRYQRGFRTIIIIRSRF